MRLISVQKENFVVYLRLKLTFYSRTVFVAEAMSIWNETV